MSKKHIITAKCFDKKGKLISEAKNSYTKSHPLQAYFAEMVGHKHRIYLHAEIAAIIKAGDKQIHTIEISRQSSKGDFLCAKPCPICQEAIKAFGIKFVKWTIST